MALIPFTVNLLYPIPSCEISVLRGNVLVISFSERVVDFTETDVEITGGTISEFIGNGREFCITVEVITTAEIYVPSGVAHSEHNQPNTESNRLTYNA